MSIEFVEPEHAPAGAAARSTTAARGDRDAPTTSVRTGRLLGAVWALAGVATVLAVLAPVGQVRRTAFIVDFDRIDEQVIRIDVDAFGGTRFVSGSSTFGGGDRSALLASAAEPAWGPAWIVVGVLLLAVGGWALLRPQSRRPAVVATALGAVLLGNAASIRALLHLGSGNPAANIGVQLVPGAGFWIVAVAASVSVVVGLVAACAPRVRPARLRLPRRRRRPAAAAGDPTGPGVELT